MAAIVLEIFIEDSAKIFITISVQCVQKPG